MSNDMPQAFRHVRLELAREQGHPVGDADHGYDILMPLNAENRIDGTVFKSHHAKCRVRRFRPDENDKIGVMARGPGGHFYFDYDDTTDRDDEPGFRFEDEKFLPGEYVSVREDDGQMHTFVVTKVVAL